MFQIEFSSRRKFPLALSVRISFILMLAAVLPLLITVGVSESLTTRPALINQANQTMKADADTRIQLINTYLNERILDAETISVVPSVQAFMAITPTDPPSAELLAAAQTAGYALNAGKFRDSHYITWRYFYPDGVASFLSAPQGIQPHQYGSYLVPPQELHNITTDKTILPIISPVYYDAILKKAFLDIYSPIYQNGNPSERFLGFMRASLNLDYIWDIVQNDQGINHSGRAFILDNNGVRIADSDRNSSDLFTAVAPIDANTLASIKVENWYGQDGKAPTIHPNQTLSDAVTGKDANTTFPLTLTVNSQNTDYQAAISKAIVVKWTYVVISPSSAVTQVADQQLVTTLLVAIAVAAVAAVAGWFVASRISRPIMRSVDQLRESSEALNILAKKQQSASSEQLWVVDSVQVGLQSVQYYTDATRIAARKLGELGTDLERNWHRQNTDVVWQSLQQVISTANYIEKATSYQGESDQKLSTAIQVTTQVNEQLADGAISATEAASQLEQVVSDLRNVVGQ
ncbi:MAG: cache domain-containing protein [Ktedonobacteraceae bacterium]